MSEAIRKEFARNTHYKVTSGDTGDLVLKGEVLGYSTTPTVLDEGGAPAQYAVSIVLKVLVTETATGKALFQNDAMVFGRHFSFHGRPAILSLKILPLFNALRRSLLPQLRPIWCTGSP